MGRVSRTDAPPQLCRPVLHANLLSVCPKSAPVCASSDDVSLCAHGPLLLEQLASNVSKPGPELGGASHGSVVLRPQQQSVHWAVERGVTAAQWVPYGPPALLPLPRTLPSAKRQTGWVAGHWYVKLAVHVPADEKMPANWQS